MKSENCVSCKKSYPIGAMEYPEILICSDHCKFISSSNPNDLEKENEILKTKLKSIAIQADCIIAGLKLELKQTKETNMFTNPKTIDALEAATRTFFAHLRGDIPAPVPHYDTNYETKSTPTKEKKAPEKKEAPKKWTIDDLRTAAQDCVKRHDKAYAIKIVNDFGYKSINEVPTEKIEALIELLNG